MYVYIYVERLREQQKERKSANLDQVGTTFIFSHLKTQNNQTQKRTKDTQTHTKPILVVAIFVEISS